MPELPEKFWVGTDESGGIPNPGRPDTAAPPHWRLEAVAATERPRHPDVAPDGTKVAFALDRDTSDMWTIAAAGGPPTQVTTGRVLTTYWDDDGPRWSPDGSTLAYAASGSVWTVPTGGGPPVEVCAGSSPVWLDDQRLLVGVERTEAGVERTVLASVDRHGRWPVGLAGGDGDVAAPVVSPDGRRVAYEFHPFADLNCSAIHVVDVDGGGDTTLVRLPGMHARGAAWSPDGTLLAYTCEAPGWFEVFVVDVAGGGEPRQVTCADGDIGELQWFPTGDRLLGTRTTAGVTDLVTIDVAAPGGVVGVVAAGGTWSSPRLLADGSIVAVHEAHDIAPRLVVVAPGGAVRELLAPTPASIRTAPHVTPEHVAFRAPDGVEVYGFLFRPTGAGADRPVAAIVNPHGGPTDHAGDDWDGVAQYFIDKGYAWLTLNFRGSTSYGREFERANHGVWGVADTTDCLAAHDFLARLDWIDQRRIAIFGASYGSYLALLSVVDDPSHRYACAVAKYGDCDIVTSWAQGDRVGRLDLERMMGHPADHPAAYRAASPIHRIDQLTVPILVVHGERDDRVHPAQSIELVEALRRRGATYEYITYPTEGHGLLRTGPFLHFHRRLERFLDWYLR